MRNSMLVLLSLALTGCATLQVKIDHHAEDAQIRKDREFASSEAAKDIASGEAAALFNQAQGLPLTDERRLTLLLASAHSILTSGKLSDGAERLYNSAVRQIVAMLGAGGIKDRAIRGAGEVTRLVVQRAGKDIVDPGLWDSLVTVDEVRIKRLYKRSMQSGWGVAYVAYFPKDAGFLKDQPGIPKAGMCLPVTGIVTFRD
ncbi:MAG: hypothetical protein WAM53_10670, partial [Terrimicrobiaceae bacterium]